MTKEEQNSFYTSLSYVKLIDQLDHELRHMKISESERIELKSAVRYLKKDGSHFREEGMKTIISFLITRCK